MQGTPRQQYMMMLSAGAMESIGPSVHNTESGYNNHGYAHMYVRGVSVIPLTPLITVIRNKTAIILGNDDAVKNGLVWMFVFNALSWTSEGYFGPTLGT